MQVRNFSNIQMTKNVNNKPKTEKMSFGEMHDRLALQQERINNIAKGTEELKFMTNRAKGLVNLTAGTVVGLTGLGGGIYALDAVMQNQFQDPPPPVIEDVAIGALGLASASAGLYGATKFAVNASKNEIDAQVAMQNIKRLELPIDNGNIARLK